MFAYSRILIWPLYFLYSKIDGKAKAENLVKQLFCFDCGIKSVEERTRLLANHQQNNVGFLEKDGSSLGG